MISLQQEDTIRETEKKLEPTMVCIFRIYARNENNKTSKINILIDFEKNVNLLDLIGLEQELSELLGIKVDLVTVRSVNQKLNSNIQRDLIRIV